MAIVVDRDTRLVVQGITGREGSFHATRNLRYGTNVVAGVTPARAAWTSRGSPSSTPSREAVAETSPNTAMVFVPARFAADAIYEAVDAGIETVICITEGLPAHDMLRVYNHVRPRGVTLIGPNCPGVLSPGKANVGIIPAEIFSEGSVGLVSQIRHAHVPDRARADTARYRAVHYRRNRGGPRRRVVLYGRARALRGRPRDRARRHGR